MFGIAAALGGVVAIHPRQLDLDEPHRRLQLRHSVVVADRVVDVGQLRLQLQQAEPLRHVIAVIAEAAEAPGEVLIVCDHCAALPTGGEVLALAEGESSGITNGPDFAALEHSPVGLGRILDHR